MNPNLRSRYDVVILGAGHNGLVAASYLTRAGLSVLLLEKNDYIGGATTSQRIFPDYDAVISRYSYLVSLLPEKIIRELGLKVQLKSRRTASFTPYLRDGSQSGLLVSNSSDAYTRESFRDLTKSAGEFEGWQKFYHLTRVFAEKIWGTMLEPLRSKAALRHHFGENEDARESWTGFVEEPLGVILERY